MLNETWPEHAHETFTGECEGCGEVTLLQMVEDPFDVEEIYNERTGERFPWCYRCFRERADDI